MNIFLKYGVEIQVHAMFDSSNLLVLHLLRKIANICYFSVRLLSFCWTFSPKLLYNPFSCRAAFIFGIAIHS